MRLAKSRQLMRMRRLARLQQKAATAAGEEVATAVEDDEAELMSSVPPSFEALLKQRQKMLQAAVDPAAADAVAGDVPGAPPVAPELRAEEGEEEDDDGEDDVIMMLDDNDNNQAGVGGVPDGTASKPPSGEGRGATAEEAQDDMLEPEPAFPDAVGPIIPRQMVDQMARRLRLRQILKSAEEAGVLPPGRSDHGRGIGEEIENQGFIKADVKDEKDEDWADADVLEPTLGGGLPRMLGLVPEGNAELASTYAWEEDILWGDDDDDNGIRLPAARGVEKPDTARPAVPLPTTAAAADPMLSRQGPVPLALPPPGRRPLCLHPQALRLEGIPSGEPRPPPLPAATSLKSPSSQRKPIVPLPSSMVVLSSVAQGGDGGAAGLADGASLDGNGLSALIKGPAAALSSKLRLQQGLASEDWLEELERCGRGGDAGRRQLIKQQQAPWLKGGRPSTSLAMCVPGSAPLLLDLNDPDMVFVSSQAVALR